MNNQEVRRIFNQVKGDYLFGHQKSDYPTAFLLGGQGAVGKGQLTKMIVRENPQLGKIFFINGDVYRNEHPENRTLRNNPETYSAETQIFSSVFTEGFVGEAIRRKLNISIEGTMRNPQTPLKTASLLHENGFRVEAYVIAAPVEFSSLNLYTRYANELINGELGRLADKASHDKAAEMMPETLNILYRTKAVDAIHIYSCFAKYKVADYILTGNGWNNKTLPSVYIHSSREEQKSFNDDIIRSLLEKSRIIENVISNDNILRNVEKARLDLEKLLIKSRGIPSTPETRELENDLKEKVSDFLKGRVNFPWVRDSISQLAEEIHSLSDICSKRAYMEAISDSLIDQYKDSQEKRSEELKEELLQMKENNISQSRGLT